MSLRVYETYATTSCPLYDEYYLIISFELRRISFEHEERGERVGTTKRKTTRTKVGHSIALVDPSQGTMTLAKCERERDK